MDSYKIDTSLDILLAIQLAKYTHMIAMFGELMASKLKWDENTTIDRFIDAILDQMVVFLEDTADESIGEMEWVLE